VSFFEVPEVRQKPRRRRRRVKHEDHGWSAPSLYLPGRLPSDFVLASTGDHAVLVADIACYPSGFGFEVRTVGRYYDDEDDPDAHFDLMSMRRRSSGAELPPALLRFGIAFSDGRKATTLNAPQWGRDSEGPGPNLHITGGGGGGSTWTCEMWVTPLPPDGPVAFVCEWPAFGIGETRRSIPGARIRRAAERARPVF
jgi:hypothetical protein